jgi:hypothetical protein
MGDRDDSNSAIRFRELAAECEELAALATDRDARNYYQVLAAYYFTRAGAGERCDTEP